MHITRSILRSMLLLAVLCLSACPAGDEAVVVDNTAIPVGTGQSKSDAGIAESIKSTTDGKPVMGSTLEENLPFALPGIPAPDSATETASIATIGNFRGFQKPCSCTPEQEGGLARLGSLLQGLQASGQFSISSQAEPMASTTPDPADLHIPPGLSAQPLWLIELGNFSGTQLHFPGLRSRTHLQILAAIGGRAAIPGASELGLELGDAVAGLGNSPIPLVSCNLQIKPEAQSIATQPFLQLADNWFLIGISSATDSQGLEYRQDWWELSDARSAALATLAGLPQDCHIVVAGSNLDKALAGELLADKRVACCIGLPGYTQRENADDPELFSEPHSKATVLDIYIIDNAGQVTDWGRNLDQALPDDERVMALIQHEAQLSKEKLRERRAARAAAAGFSGKPEFGMSDKFLPQSERKFSYDDAASYVGGESCLHCHREAASTWRSTRHAGALHSLKSEGQSDMLDCLSCHSTGLLETGGYDPLEPAPEMAAVGCESCHGPGSHHVQAMENPGERPEGSLISRGSVDTCIRCHDPYNSPHFEFEKYWEQIRH